MGFVGRRGELGHFVCVGEVRSVDRRCVVRKISACKAGCGRVQVRRDSRLGVDRLAVDGRRVDVCDLVDC